MNINNDSRRKFRDLAFDLQFSDEKDRILNEMILLMKAETNEKEKNDMIRTISANLDAA